MSFARAMVQSSMSTKFMQVFLYQEAETEMKETSSS